jgi:2-iminobutanoate/2-iminopropanoate deaminase
MRRTSCTLVALSLILLFGCTAPPHRATLRTCFHESESVETEIGYCSAVRSGQMLYISGSAAKGDMASAIPKVYKNLQETLEANGLTFANVVKENVYATDLGDFIQNKNLRKQFYVNAPLPAATWVQVQRLYSPALILEVELIAEYPR